MALIERGESSPGQVRANRANAQKSTGPRTARGKREVARNASKRGLLTDLFTESMRELGEDPAAFRSLHGGFVDSLRPANLLEEALVADLAKVWWKKARAERAQSGYQVHEIEKLEQAHRQKLLGMDPEDHPGEEIIAGTTRISESCATNYHQVIGPLMYLLETVDKGDWLEDPEDLLAKIYGDFPTPRGVLIKQTFAEWLRSAEELDDARMRREEQLDADAEAGSSRQVPAKDSPRNDLDFQQLLGGEPAIGAADLPEGPASPHPAGDSPAVEREQELRTGLKTLLLEEIQEVTREYELYQAAHAPLTAAARLAHMAPCGEWQGGRGNAWPLMLRQEASLERQFDRSLRLLLILRGANSANGRMNGRGRSKGLRPQTGKSQKVASAFRPTRSGTREHISRPRETRKNTESEKQSRYIYENTGATQKKRASRPAPISSARGLASRRSQHSSAAGTRTPARRSRSVQ